MAPTLAQSTARNESVIRAAFPEIISFVFIFMFLAWSLFTPNDAFSLIQSPIFVTLLFMGLNTPLQITLYLVLGPMLNSHEEADSYQLGKKRYGVQQITSIVVKSLIAFLGVWVAMHVTAVIFGAHFIKDAEKTTVWAAMVSSLIVTPGLCILGPKLRKWMAFFCLKLFDSAQKRTFYYCVVTTLVGCWASPVVIPLDWDRPWQVWPIPGVTGAMLGYCVGLLIGGLKILQEMKFSKVH